MRTDGYKVNNIILNVYIHSSYVSRHINTKVVAPFTRQAMVSEGGVVWVINKFLQYQQDFLFYRFWQLGKLFFKSLRQYVVHTKAFLDA